MLQNFKEFLIVQVILFFHWLMRSTWRGGLEPLPQLAQDRIAAGLPVVFAHLHQDDLTIVGYFVGTPVGVLVSQSKDGNLLAKFFRKIGFVPARGSSSRGAASGFLELLRVSKELKLTHITFAVDGPRGPVGKSKNGVFKLAELLNAPVLPTVALASSRWTLSRSWSKTYIPKPFSKITVKFLEPIPAELISQNVKEKNYDSLTSILDEQIRSHKLGYF